MERPPRVLVTGAGGQVGRALASVWPDATFARKDDLDVADAVSVMAAVHDHDVVVHLAALTDVDGCEVDAGEAERVNVGGTRNVVAAAATSGARVILLSTDYVFDGRSTVPYRENDEPGPLNVYGRTKRDAEDIVRSSGESLIVRTSWVFGHGRNFIRTILAATGTSDSIRVVDDQRATPTSAGAVAGALGHAIERSLTGTLHVAGEGDIVSWAEFAAFVLQVSGVSARVEPVTSAEYAATRSAITAPRPAFSALDTTRARDFGVPLLDWRAAVTTYVEGEA